MRNFFVPLALLLWPNICHGQVVFSEIHWAGSELSTADEWFELFNASDEEVNLEGWSVTTRKSDGSDAEMIVFEDYVLAPQAVLLISNYDTDSSALTVHPHLVDTSVSLPNSKLYLQLLDTEKALIDAVDDGVGAPFAGGREPYASMQRTDPFADGASPDSWVTASQSIGLEGVFGDPGEFHRTELQTSSSSSAESSVSSEVLERQVLISEVMTNPEGSDDYEWIEIQNTGDISVNVLGWKLSDQSRSYAIVPRDENGYLLLPGEYAVFFGYETGLKLSNGGEVISLTEGEKEVDRLDVSETAEGVSFGRKSDGSRSLFCVPTPRAENSDRVPEVEVVTQSGRATDYTRVTLNLNVEPKLGSLAGARCVWDFKDGTSSEKCNPPSHTWDTYGVYDIDLLVTTACGDSIRKSHEVVVLQKNKYKRSSVSSAKSSGFSTSKLSSKSLNIAKISNSSSSLEQKMYSNSSTSLSSQNRVVALPTYYANIVPASVENPRESNSDSGLDNRVLSLLEANYNNLEQTSAADGQGIVWLLLFSQSAVWLILVGKKLI